MSSSRRNETLVSQLLELQTILITEATTGAWGDQRVRRERDDRFRTLRQTMLDTGEVERLLPSFLHACHDIAEFGEFIKAKFAHYAERRTFIRDGLRPVFDVIEGRAPSPVDAALSTELRSYDEAGVIEAWDRAASRRNEPEAAITAARTLVETVCKHILNDRGVPFDDGIGLPKLYRLAGAELKLAPDQHTEQIFKQILGGCQAVVEGLGSVRNRLSDAHGRGKGAVRPRERHAHLAVNLAGAMALFLIQTHTSTGGEA